MIRWIAVYNSGGEKESEIHVFHDRDAMWAWLDKLAETYLADGDFHDDDDHWAHMAGLGRETNNVELILNAINGFLGEVYKNESGKHLQVVEREV